MTRRNHFGSVRTLPSGRWQASYWHEGARHIGDRTFEHKADAQAWLAGVETDVHRGGWVDPAGARMTVEELARWWLAADPTKRTSSRARDDAILRCHVLSAIGPAILGAVTPAVVQRLVHAWTAEQAASTVRRQYSALRAMFAYAVNADLLARSPCRNIRLPSTVPVERPQPTPDELQFLAEALGQDHGAMMWLAVHTGLRWAECAGLQVRDVDWLGYRVLVSRQLLRDGTLGPPKSSASARPVAVEEWLVADLSAILARRGLGASDREALVFAGCGGQPLAYTNWRRRTWLPACEAAGLPGLRFHVLHSLNATLLIAGGVDVKTAQSRLDTPRPPSPSASMHE